METVVLDGIQYLKASVAAKQFRYTADYVGQLCRAKKIDARLVGRTWFVNPDSLKHHKRTRHQKVKQEDGKVATEVTSTTSVTKSFKVPVKKRKEVAPRLKSATLKQLSEQAARLSNERRLHVFYEPDEENLMPTLHKKPSRPPRTIRIEPVGAKKVAITGGKQVASFQAEELPEVALSGKLSVEDYSDSEPEEEGGTESLPPDATSAAEGSPSEKLKNDRSNKKNKAISSKEKTITVLNNETSVAKVHVKVSLEKEQDKQSSQHTTTKKSVAANVLKTAGHQNSPRKANVHEKLSSKGRTTSFGKAAPESATVPVTSFTPSSVQDVAPQRVPVLVMVSPLIATVVAAFLVLGTFSASVTVVASDSGYSSHVDLRVVNLLEIFAPQ